MASEDIARKWFEQVEADAQREGQRLSCRRNQKVQAMDTPKVLTRDEALSLVRRYKEVISARFDCEPRVYLFGSYSKGNANPWSDIDVAVILPSLKDEDWLELSADLWHDVDKVSLLIEPVLMSEEEDTMLYRDVMRTGIAA